MTGFVSLVGAGPGDPELLTLKAADRLRRADVVLYDALVPAAMLRLAPRAQRFCVGKRAGRHFVSQQVIQRLMIRAARRGRRVVRLKGGDPFVLGRGGEEALALATAVVPFELVPGVSAAIAAPERAGIPVTHRGISSAVLIVSGHAAAAFRPVLSGLAPNAATIVVLMGLGARRSLAALLLERGWRPGTPAAIVRGASTPAESIAWGTLADLEKHDDAGLKPAGLKPCATDTGGATRAECIDAGSDEPGTIVIGEVVAVGARIAQALGTTAVAQGFSPASHRR